MKLELQNIALQIYSICLTEHVRLEVEWVPREENTLADAWSRVIDWDDWSVSDWIFDKLNECWGPFTTDRFADDKNAKLPRFNSRFWVPNTEQVDAFSTPWTGENNWLAPPPKLIIRTLKHLLASRALATILIPKWRAQPFWPVLESIRKHTDVVKEEMILNPCFNLFMRGSQPSSIFGPGFPSPVLALKLDSR